MPVDGGRDGAEEVAAHGLRSLRHAALDPHLIRGLPPAGEHADAVAARCDLVEVLGQRVPAKALEARWRTAVGGLDVQRDPGDRAERAEADDEAVEAGVASVCREDLATRGDHLQRGNGRRQVSVRVARPVGGGGDGTGDGDVRQRAHVLERQALGGQRFGQRAIRESRGEAHRSRVVVDDHVRSQAFERQELRRVADVREGVARAEDAHARRRRDDLLHLLDAWPVDALGSRHTCSSRPSWSR